MAEIKLTYSGQPKGHIGPRPQQINKNESCVFTCADPGTFEIEFLNGSPAHSNATKFDKHGSFVADKPGRFKFQCTFIRPNGTTVVVGGPNDAELGGEIEIGL
jgi:hypothetical protein